MSDSLCSSLAWSSGAQAEHSAIMVFLKASNVTAQLNGRRARNLSMMLNARFLTESIFTRNCFQETDEIVRGWVRLADWRTERLRRCQPVPPRAARP